MLANYVKMLALGHSPHSIITLMLADESSKLHPMKLLSITNCQELGFCDPVRVCMIVNASAMALGGTGEYGEYKLHDGELILVQ